MKCEMDYGQKLSLMRNELMRVMDERERYYSIIIESIFQIVRAKGPCDACKPHSREETCAGFPQNAACAQYQDSLISYSSLCRFVADEDPSGLCRRGNWCSSWPPWPAWRCGSIRCSYTPCARRHFLTKSSPYQVSRQSAQECPSQTLHRKVPRTMGSPPSSASSKSQVRAATVLVENTEAIVRNLNVVGSHASARLYPQEQQVFHEWMTTPFSFPSSSPKLEQQALAAFKDPCQLPSQIQADIRHWILQTLLGAMGRPA